MSKFLLILLGLCGFAPPAHADQPPTYPWWGKTTRALDVRHGDDITGHLAKGQTVYVLYPDTEEGWVDIEYDLNPETQHRVLAANLVPFAMPERKAVEVGERSFLVFSGGHEKHEVRIGGHTYSEGTAFDVIPSGDQDLIVGPDGKASDVTAEQLLPYGNWYRVKWDLANNVPTTYDYKTEYFRRYYHGFTRLLSHRWFYWTFFLILLTYVGFFTVGIGEPKACLWAFLLLVPLWIGSCQGDGYNALQHRAEIAGGLLVGVQTEYGNFKPIPPYWISHPKGDWLFFGDWLWVPVFVLCHVLLLPLFPWAFRGAHFLLIPHPVEKHLASVLAGRVLDPKKVTPLVGCGNLEKPRPQWISQNQRRRLDAMRERFEAETRLLETVIGWKRRKAEFKDQ